MKTIPIRYIADTHQQQITDGRFSIRSISDVLKGKDLIHDLHKHDFYFILAVEQGTGVHEIDFVSYDVQDGAIFILRPGQVHQLRLKADCTGYLLEFDNSFYQPKNSITEQQWRKATGRNYCQVEEIRFKRLHTYLTNSLNELTLKQEGYNEAIKANMDLFFIEFVRQSQNPKQPSAGITTYIQERYEQLLRLLEANITDVKSVSEYAKLLNLSLYQLNAITKASVGKTTAELINEQIILEAKRYLLATPNQIKDIAWHLGYEDTSYFIRFFKNHTGQSPDAFRKNFK
ncbi:MAG: AraC family transcriptional regulator [Dyadobacter sp. 50-39]|uniref:AraC family transcriptional regulator n=1 Tax=Dyadobacter sp. 50-39 TaxID=1895756 RepID=UPI00095A9FA3|nr:AraC family transcriptional regulator [Dyadobacter sp. 50-39]OJV19724.1 MAG: AraC family transcriptional regulator [Dyadobacter sp. 50-39]